MPDLPRLKDTTNLSPIWDAIDEWGGVIVEDFIASDLLDRIRTEIASHTVSHTSGSTNASEFWKDFHGTTTKRITGLATKSPGWVELMCDARYIAMGDHYLGERNYHLNTAQLICIGPGETPQMLHRDEQNWPKAVQADSEITITAIFALTDFTQQNGATVIVPGSNRWGDDAPAVEPDQCCQATMRAGSALLYSGKVIHGGGENRTADEWRVALHAGFVLGWLRPEENHQLTTSLDVARKLPEHVQHLLDFRSYEQPLGGRLGLVDYNDAGDLLDPRG